MSDHKKRIETLKVLIAGSVISNDPGYTHILGELNEVKNVKKVKDKNRYRLLQVLHSTRALDSTLKAYVTYHRYPTNMHSLGGYLTTLTQNNVIGRNQLPSNARIRFQQSIVDVRNLYMHKAGTYPSRDEDIRALLSEMHDCLIKVISL